MFSPNIVNTFFGTGHVRRAALLAFAGIIAIPFASIANAAPGSDGLGRARFSWEAVADPIVSGYKVYWGTGSGVYTHSFDAGNVTEVIITAFTEGVEYFSAVTAYSDTGEESGYSEEVPFIYDTTDRVLFLEAENGVLTAPMKVSGDAPNSWVAASPADPAAATTLSFNTPYASDFYVWCRVLAPSSSADSLFVTVDQQAELVYDIYGEPSPPAAAYQSSWTWSRIQVSPGTARAFALEGGSHSIRFRYRENTWLDRVVIVSNPDFVPTDALPRSGDFVELVDQPQASSVTTGSSVSFSATLVATGPLSVQWFHNGVAVPDSSQMSLSLSNVQTSAAGSYTLCASRNSATVTSQPATLTVLSVGGTATPLVTTKPTASDIVYGQTLAACTLSGGVASVPGSFAFTAPTTAPATGTASQTVTFTPSDTSSYQIVTTSVNVTVLKAMPLITTPPTASGIAYGQTLASSTLSGGAASVPGSFAFTTPTITPAAGTASQNVTFTPADTLNYQIVTASVSVTVTTTATVTLCNLAATYDGTPKCASATTNPTGLTVKLTYIGLETTPKNAGSYAVVATIVDATHTGSASGTLVIAKATPLITTQPLACGITYGQSLAGSTLSRGAASVPGSFAFNTPTTVPTAGTAPQSVTFTPTDTSNYQTATTSVNVTISKVTPLITTQPTASGITYGQTLAGSTLSGGTASVPGSFAFTTPTTVPAAGTASQSVTFTPTDTLNYQIVTTSVNVTVTNTTATVTLGNLATTYDGTPKSASATTNPAGLTVNLTYNGLATAPKNAGNHAVVATIVDANHTGSASGTLVIAKATPVITTQPATTEIIYGQTLASSTLSGGAASVPGSFVFTTPTTVAAVGTASQSVTFTPTDTSNYKTVTTSVNVTVSKAKPLITTEPTATEITYGQTLASSTLSGGAASVPGAFGFSTPTMVPAAGTASQSVTFIPSDTGKYQIVTANVSVTVHKAAATVMLGNLAATYDGTAKSVSATTNPAGISVNLTYDGLATIPKNTGSYAVVATIIDANYLGSGSGTLLVAKGMPVITTQPTASAITYDQTLASSTLSGGAASVPGSFAFTTPATAPAAGTATQSMTFTPTDTGNYQIVTANVSVTVNKVAATVTLGNLAATYDSTPKAVSATTNPAGLTVNLTYNGLATVPKNAGSYTVVATIDDATRTGSASGSLVIAKATPLITTQPTASAITYGQTLASSTLGGGAASVPGSFAFTAPATAPAAGTVTQSMTFTPTDTGNYQIVTTSVSVTVNKPSATVTLGKLAATYDGTPKFASATTNPAGLTVNLTYEGLATAPMNAGSYAVVATIDDATRTGSTSGTLVIAKATPVITTQPTATEITYGQTLANSTLNVGAASVPGSFTFTKPATAPATGSASQGVIFIPTDTLNYQIVPTSVSVVVNMAMPVITTQPTATEITYGQTLASSTLTGGTASVPGSFAFTKPATAPAAGTTSQDVTFTPTDTSNYQIVTASVSMTVKKAAATITLGKLAATYDGTPKPVSVTTNPAGLTVKLSYDGLSTAPKTAGSYAVVATIVDATRPGSASDTLIIAKATPVITKKPTAKTIVYGQTLAGSTLSGGAASVRGTFSFTTPTTVPAAGTTSQSVTFTPTDTINYNTVTASVNVTVSKATPLITARPTATEITYGQTLAGSTLTGGAASAPGSFAFTKPTAVPTVGTASQAVTFTPTDTLNYRIATTSASVTVNKQVATVTLGKLAATYDGMSKSASATTSPTGLTVKLTYNGSATAPKTAGSYAVVATIVNAYRTGSASGTLVIAKATPVLTRKPAAKVIVYGQPLASATLSSGTASVPGSFAFTTSETVPAAGTASQSVTFTPTNTVNYQPVTTSVNVMVSKVTPLITTQPTATDITYGQTLASSTLSAGVTSVPGSFAFTRPTTVPVAGTASQSVIFTPTDTDNYLTVATTTTVTVTENLPDVLAITPSSIENWRVRCFSPAQTATGQAADDADPDRDGLVNLAEYALGTNPLAFTPPLTAVRNSDGLVLTFKRPGGLSDVLYAAMSSDDMIHWKPCLLEMVADGSVQTMRAVDPLTSGNPARRFISLRFTKP